MGVALMQSNDAVFKLIIELLEKHPRAALRLESYQPYFGGDRVKSFKITFEYTGKDGKPAQYREEQVIKHAYHMQEDMVAHLERALKFIEEETISVY
jgi:hypothetical protein